MGGSCVNLVVLSPIPTGGSTMEQATPLTGEEEVDHFQRIKSGDSAARDAVVMANQGFVHEVVQGISNDNRKAAQS